MKKEEKCKKINELLEIKGVHFVEDYFFDYFKDDETEETIFQVISQRSIEDSPKKLSKVLDEILEKLSSYNKCKKCKKKIESRFRYCSIECKAQNLAT